MANRPSNSLQIILTNPTTYDSTTGKITIGGISGSVNSVTNDGAGIDLVDNTDPSNPKIKSLTSNDNSVAITTGSGEVDLSVNFPTPVNLYTSDGTITGSPRTVTINPGNSLKIQGDMINSAFNVELGISNIDVQNINLINVPAITTDNNDFILVRDSVTGEVLLRDPTSLPPSPTVNIYNSDGTITGTRTVDINSNILQFTNGNSFNVNSQFIFLDPQLNLSIGSVIPANTPTNSYTKFLVIDNTGDVQYKENTSTNTNLGVGEALLANPGSNSSFTFKTLIAGPNISLSSNANEVTITGSATPQMTPTVLGTAYGEQNTAKNVLGEQCLAGVSDSNVIGASLPNTLNITTSNVIACNNSLGNGGNINNSTFITESSNIVNPVSINNSTIITQNQNDTNPDLNQSIYIGDMTNTLTRDVSMCLNTNYYGSTITMAKEAAYFGFGRNNITLNNNSCHFDFRAPDLYYYDLANATTTDVLYYDNATSKITFGPAPSGSSSVSLNGAITAPLTALPGPVTTTISNNAVTYSKIQQASGARLLGNPNAILGNVQEIILGTNLSFSGSTLNATGAGSVSLNGDITAPLTALPGPVTTTIANNAVTTLKIANNNVTYGKIQQVAASRLLGNPTAFLGNAQEITLGSNLSFAGNILNATSGLSSILGFNVNFNSNWVPTTTNFTLPIVGVPFTTSTPGSFDVGGILNLVNGQVSLVAVSQEGYYNVTASLVINSQLNSVNSAASIFFENNIGGTLAQGGQAITNVSPYTSGQNLRTIELSAVVRLSLATSPFRFRLILNDYTLGTLANTTIFAESRFSLFKLRD